MGNTLTIKRGDTARDITDTLTIDGVAIDLTGAAVILVWKSAGVVSRKTAIIVNALEGSVKYALESADVDLDGAVFLEWEITFTDGGVLTVPTDGYIKLSILKDLG